MSDKYVSLLGYFAPLLPTLLSPLEAEGPISVLGLTWRPPKVVPEDVAGRILEVGDALAVGYQTLNLIGIFLLFMEP